MDMKHRGIAQRLIVSSCGPRVLGPEIPIHTIVGRMTIGDWLSFLVEANLVFARSSRDLYGVPCYQDQPSGEPAPFITSLPYRELLLQTNKIPENRDNPSLDFKVQGPLQTNKQKLPYILLN